MEQIFSLIVSNWVNIVCVVLILAAFMIAWVYGERQKVAKLAYECVLYAENLIIGRYEGQAKYSWAVKELLKNLPPGIRPFISEEYLEKVIEIAVEHMNEFLKGQAQIPESKKSIKLSKS